MKQAVMYGGGNIGRGFVGALLSQAGYTVTFVDVADSVVTTLQEKKEYPIRYVSREGHEDIWIRNVTAVNGKNLEQTAEAIASCDIMATAVGARILPFIVPNLVAGLRKRWAKNRGPLNILICENLMDANRVLESLIKAQLTDEEKLFFDRNVGLVEASIGRMVPIQTEEMKAGEPLRICTERYGFLPVDKAGFQGEPPRIPNMIPYEPFDFFLKRKLYVHNMGHAVCAYLGDLADLIHIWKAIDDPEIRIIVQNAMQESSMALSSAYHVPLVDIQLHITDLLHRFANRALKDTCERVGADPARKLGPDDRLIGAARLCIQQGITPSYIAVGAAAGLRRYLAEADESSTPEQVLVQISDLSEDEPLFGMILRAYRKIEDGCSVHELLIHADREKHRSMTHVV